METDLVDYTVALCTLGIYCETIDHPSFSAIKDIIDYLHITLSETLPTLVLKADDSYLVVLIRGDCKIDFKKIKEKFNIKELRMATPDEFKQLTGLPLGAARVYIPKADKTIIDKKVFEKEYLFGGSGNFTCTVKYRTSDLTNLPKSVVDSITKD